MWILFFLFLLFFTSCSPETESNVFTLTSWNAYCFFDGVDNSTEYTEFTSSNGYTREKYRARIVSCVRYMTNLMRDSDIIILEEIESEDVLNDLLEGGLKRVGFTYYGLAQRKDGELAVGFISKIKPSSFSLHMTDSSRPILEIKLLFKGEMVTLLAVHLKSQLNDKSMREEEMRLLLSLIEEKEGENVIVIGDFNSDCILGDEMGDVRKGNSFILTLTGDGSKAHSGILFSPYIDYGSPAQGGSYYYDGTWYTYDNALLTSSFFDGEGLEYLDFSIISSAEAKTTSGIPLKYDKSTGSGYSDHFAIKLTCRYY